MLTLAEISRSLEGAVRLLRGDPDGLRLLDASLSGFWRSFLTILLIAPVYVLTVIGEFGLLRATEPEAASLDVQRFALAKIAGLVFDWLAFPLLVLALAGPLGFAARVVIYIVAYNWSAVVVTALLAPPTILYAAGILPGGLALIATLVLLGIVLRYRFQVARWALGVDAVTAGALVTVDLLLSLLVGQIITRMASG